MASLLQRAKHRIDRRKEEEAIQAIPVEEREKIYSEIDRAVASNKLRIKDNTFSFTPVSSDVRLPVLINIGAFILIVGLSVAFYFLFNQAETNIVSEKETVISAEGRLIQALKEESEQKLEEKEKEILNIQSRLAGMKDEQQKLIADTEEQARLKELKLKEDFQNELEAERLKLQGEGFSTDSIEQKLKDFENLKQKEYDDQILQMKKQLEEARLERERSLNDLISGYEQNLELARSDRSKLEEKLKQEFSEKEQALEEERDTAVSQLQALKEESEQKLGEKETEISNIQSRLAGMEDEQQKLIADTEEQARLKELKLKEDFQNELEAERLKLQIEGQSAASIEQKLREFQALKQKEYENQIVQMKKQLEDKRMERERSLNDLISGYEQNLESAKTDHFKLEEKLKEEFSKKEQALEEERNTAVSQLARLDEQQKQEKLVIDQILSIYTKTNEFIKNNQYEEALSNLDNLESLLNEGNIMNLPAIQYRREVDFIMIRSLRKLVESEKQLNETDTDSLIESANLIAAVSGLVEEGNRYFEEGDLEAARESYINAISKVPALEGGFNSLKNIEEIDQQEERENFILGLTEGDRYFRSKDFKSAIEKYRQALEYFETDSDVVDRMVTQLVDAGLGIETSRGNTLISSSELSSLNEAKIQQQERENLISELSLIEKKFDISAEDDAGNSNYTENLISFLDTKILLKEVIASDSIREEYPDLHEKMELYFDAYGKEKEMAGRDAALKEIVAITEYLSQEGGSDISIDTPEEEQQRELFLQFLQNLKDLFELGG